MKKSIMVTGGAGYIGSHTVVALVEAGYEPVIVDNFSNADHTAIKGLKTILGFDVKLYEGDCTDMAFMRSVFAAEKDIVGVIHFAAFKAVGESVQKPAMYYENNLDSLLTVIKAMGEADVSHFVFSSSCTVYGQPESLPVTEDTPKQPAESPYGATKLMCEQIIEDHCKSGAAFKAVALRYFNPIGAHPSAVIGELPLGVPANLVPFITQTAAGIREQLTVFGNDYDTQDGSCIRDYIHVMDLADAHVKALSYLDEQTNTSFHDVFNVGTGQGNTVLEVVGAFQKVSGVKLNYVIGSRRPGDIEKIYANADKVNTVLKWQAKRSLEEALCDAWAWQEHLGRVKA